jgi:hypothetical protein
MNTPSQQPFTPEQDKRGEWSVRADPALPNVLILGDSISVGYTRAVRELLAGRANVYRPMVADGSGPDNCGDTRRGLARIEEWLSGPAWDAIHFNWGLHDLCYRNPEAANQGNRDKSRGAISVPLPEYGANLERLVLRLRAAGAELVWASTTLVPEGEPGRFAGDEVKYNAAAAEVMARLGAATDDLHALTRGFKTELFSAPGNVHYTLEGYRLLGGQVAASIETALVRRGVRRK